MFTWCTITIITTVVRTQEARNIFQNCLWSIWCFRGKKRFISPDLCDDEGHHGTNRVRKESDVSNQLSDKVKCILFIKYQKD